VLRRIFDRNQLEFTKANPSTIPTIAVIEEAQSVLNERASAATPFVEWIKEGRKYDLGAVLITQQPESIPQEILSQGDNWFLFHMLAEGDLSRARNANAHFSRDLLASLLNEPIPGQGIFWSSVANAKYPLPLRVLSFEKLVQRADPSYVGSAISTYAASLKIRFRQKESASSPAVVGAGESRITDDAPSDLGHDPLRAAEQFAVEALRRHKEFVDQIDRGIPWGRIFGILRDSLPEDMDDRDGIAKGLVVRAITAAVGGEQNVAWTTERRGTKNTLFVFRR